MTDLMQLANFTL